MEGRRLGGAEKARRRGEKVEGRRLGGAEKARRRGEKVEGRRQGGGEKARWRAGDHKTGLGLSGATTSRSGPGTVARMYEISQSARGLESDF